MSVMDIRKSYLDRPTDTHADFDKVSRQVQAKGSGWWFRSGFPLQ